MSENKTKNDAKGEHSVQACRSEGCKGEGCKSEAKKAANEEVIREVYKNTQIALQSISSIIGEVEDADVAALIKAQHERYEEISSQAALVAKSYEVEVKEPAAIKKAMLWTSVKLNTLTDNSPSHISETMIRGTVMGITELTKVINENKEIADEPVMQLAEKLLDSENANLEEFKKFL